MSTDLSRTDGTEDRSQDDVEGHGRIRFGMTQESPDGQDDTEGHGMRGN